MSRKKFVKSRNKPGQTSFPVTKFIMFQSSNFSYLLCTWNLNGKIGDSCLKNNHISRIFQCITNRISNQYRNVIKLLLEAEFYLYAIFQEYLSVVVWHKRLHWKSVLLNPQHRYSSLRYNFSWPMEMLKVLTILFLAIFSY